MFSEQQSLKIITKRIKNFPETLAILGSGWNKVLDGAPVEAEIPFSELFGVEATVPGHEGRLVVAKIDGCPAAFLSGRFHMYEGYSAREATLPIRVLAQAGIKQLVLTAACGALNEKYQVGDFVVLSDVLSLFLSLDNPLVGPQFQDLSQAFDPQLRALARRTLVAENIPFHEGVYAYYHGPNYESPADKMALRFLGADVVGMSTVPETIMARWLKLRVLGLAFVTNLAFVKHDHREVLAAAEASNQAMAKLLRGVLLG